MDDDCRRRVPPWARNNKQYEGNKKRLSLEGTLLPPPVGRAYGPGGSRPSISPSFPVRVAPRPIPIDEEKRTLFYLFIFSIPGRRVCALDLVINKAARVARPDSGVCRPASLPGAVRQSAPQRSMTRSCRAFFSRRAFPLSLCACTLSRYYYTSLFDSHPERELRFGRRSLHWSFMVRRACSRQCPLAAAWSPRAKTGSAARE